MSLIEMTVTLQLLCFHVTTTALPADSGSAYRGSNPWGAAKFYTAFSNIPNFLATLCHHCVTTCRAQACPPAMALAKLTMW